MDYLQNAMEIAAARKELIDHGFNVNPALIAIVQEKGIEYLIPKRRGRKVKEVKETRPKVAPVMRQWKEFCKAQLVDPVMPTRQDIGNFWRHHRQALGDSRPVLQFMGDCLLGKQTIENFSHENSSYTIGSLGRADGWEETELGRLGLPANYLGNFFRVVIRKKNK